jgi:hypothetical protein
MKPQQVFLTSCALIAANAATAHPILPMEALPAEVDFRETDQTWDGFGFNYVEACQTRDYEQWPQDYGGFSRLDDAQKAEIIELVFSEEGLGIDLVKMFLDPWHQAEPGGAFNHEHTTANMLEFVEGGVALARLQGRELEVITTLYGPPPWATRQKHIGGRDLDVAMMTPLADYIIDWARFLKAREIPVRYLSIHNEGEDFYRWDFEDGTQRLERFDYNLYWPPKLVNRFIIHLDKRLRDHRMSDLGVTNGEPSNWSRFYNWGYAKALYDHEEALHKLDLLTTHGFINGNYMKLSYSNANANTTALLRSKRPELRTWITSFAWGDMGNQFVKMIHEHIYLAKVNAVIPWAGIQVPSQWMDGDSLGNAITVHEDGTYELTSGYYVYKQLTQAGHPGMKVAYTSMANPVSHMIAFAGGDTGHPDAFVIESDIYIWKLPFKIKIKGSKYKRFRAYRTLTDGSEHYEDLGVFAVTDGGILYDAPRFSITTFIGVDE